MSSSRRAARAAVVLGSLAVLAVPAALLAAQVLAGVTLLRALYLCVPVSFVLALGAVVVARRARLAGERTVFAQRRGPVRAARLVAWLGVYVAVTAALALAVYGVLRARH